jgi:hypothetical protein
MSRCPLLKLKGAIHRLIVPNFTNDYTMPMWLLYWSSFRFLNHHYYAQIGLMTMVASSFAENIVY